jgi:UDP-N-acetylmuramate: L-alanyl-gamma-D-glutamyl-meso-diaminopimelate ligase
VVAEIGGVTLVDDFAHHPTAVAATLDGMRERYPGRRLWAVFEFRSNSAIRRQFQEPYHAALSRADRVALPPILRHHRLAAEELLDPMAIATGLTASGTPAQAASDLDHLLEILAREVETGDVLLVMSSGSFGGLLPRLTRRLRAARQASPSPTPGPGP